MAVNCEPPDQLAPGHGMREYHVAGTRDPVAVVRLSTGGLISYRKPDGRYFHTLGTEEGFRRKLEALGIRVDAGEIANGAR